MGPILQIPGGVTVSFEIHFASQTLSAEIEIEEIDLRVSPGEVVVLVGPSGAGKSTILEAMAGLHPTISAVVIRDGVRVSTPSRAVQLAFQDDVIPPWLTVRQTLRMVDRTEAPEPRLRELIGVFELDDVADSFTSQLSGGERSRLCLARAFVDPPSLLLLDEPFRNLDFGSQMRIAPWVYNRIRELKVATILVSHDIAQSAAIGRVIHSLGRAPLRVLRVYDRERDDVLTTEDLTRCLIEDVAAESLSGRGIDP